MSYRLLSIVTRTAKKPHRCIWCGEPINTGEQYADERSAYDGRIQRHRWHPDCQVCASDGWNRGDDDEFTPHSNPRPKPDTMQ